MTLQKNIHEDRVFIPHDLNRRPQACAHCHARKVRCDAWQVGLPCTRCKRRGQTSTCVLTKSATASGRRSQKRRKTINVPLAPESPEDRSPELIMHPENPDSSGYTDASEAFIFQDAGDATQLEEDLRQSGNVLPPLPPTIVSVDPASGIADTQTSTAEEDVHYRICEEMSRTRKDAVSPAPPLRSAARREVIELHEGVNPMTILGEALGRHKLNRFVRFTVEDEGAKVAADQQIPGLDSVDMAYLQAKGALDFPSEACRAKLLRLYFSYVYPYAPILDRVKFMTLYRLEQHSPFVLQAMFANVIPYATQEILTEAGFQDRTSAQKSFYTKATLLYDMKCEKNQLCLLQGSIMLSSLSFSYSMDKDYRYWLSNATRIATQMGLHRDYICESLGEHSKRLFRRIWWVLYNRDILLVVSGIDNLRRFDDWHCDTAPLKESDLEEDTEFPSTFQDILVAGTRIQRLFLVEYSNLSTISGLFIRDFKSPASSPTSSTINQLSEKLANWRKQLPAEILCALHDEHSADNILVLVLLAMGYRLTAIFYRAAKTYFRSQQDSPAYHRMEQKQEAAMFELSTLVQRASMHEVLNLCPLSFMICACTNLAMRIEISLDPKITSRKLLATKAQILAEMEYVRDGSEQWNALIWPLRMFEIVLAKSSVYSTTPPNSVPDPQADTVLNNTKVDAHIPQLEPSKGTWSLFGDALSQDFEFGESTAEEPFSILPLADGSDWLDQLFFDREDNVDTLALFGAEQDNPR